MAGAVSCMFLAGPWTGRDPVQYKIAGALLLIGVALWLVTVFINRATRQHPADPRGDDAGTSALRN
jgi:hypothetical protein